MPRLGGTNGPLAILDRHVLRLVGLVCVASSGAVTWASVATDAGLRVPGAETVETRATDVETLELLVAFSVAHPAYTGLLVLGLALVVLGDDAPLLGS